MKDDCQPQQIRTRLSGPVHRQKNHHTGETHTPKPGGREAQEDSPTTKPCANSEITGTAGEQSPPEERDAADDTAAAIKAGPVPLYLIPQTISSEIHAHGGSISRITVRRTGQHVYAITLTKIPPKGRTAGGADAD